MTGRAVIVDVILEFDVAHQSDEGLVAAVLKLAGALAGRATQTGPLERFTPGLHTSRLVGTSPGCPAR